MAVAVATEVEMEKMVSLAATVEGWTAKRLARCGAVAAAMARSIPADPFGLAAGKRRGRGRGEGTFTVWPRCLSQSRRTRCVVRCVCVCVHVSKLS